MNAVRFKVSLDKLEMLDWEQWGKDDKDHFYKVASDNNVDVIHVRSLTLFEGTPERMFYFLKDLTYRYDIELI